MSPAEYPDLDWFYDPENWARWSGLLGMRLQMELVDMVEDGQDLAQALNELIDIEGQRLIANNIPTEVREAFKRQYREQRVELMYAAAELLELRQRQSSRRRRKRPQKSD